MTLGKNYIKKELRNFTFVLLGIALVEFVVLFVLDVNVMVQFFTQAVACVTMIAAMIRTVSRVWPVWESTWLQDNSNGRPKTKN